MELIRIGNYFYNAQSRLLTLAGSDRKLSPKENLILQMLAQKPGEQLSVDLILKDVWQNRNRENLQSLNVFIAKLRNYLNEDPSNLIEIENIKGESLVLNIRKIG